MTFFIFYPFWEVATPKSNAVLQCRLQENTSIDTIIHFSRRILAISLANYFPLQNCPQHSSNRMNMRANCFPWPIDWTVIYEKTVEFVDKPADEFFNRLRPETRIIIIIVI